MQQDIKMRFCNQWDWILEGEGTQRPPQRSEPPLGSAWACSLVCGGRARLSFPVCGTSTHY